MYLIQEDLILKILFYRQMALFSTEYDEIVAIERQGTVKNLIKSLLHYQICLKLALI